ncbi:fibronectin type III domain-containing protein [Lactococcus lactis]|nr:fibronectin type III domain-containing protein [Lactococcus lactis]
MADKNYLHTAYANSADGTDGFTTVYPNLNLGDNTKTFVGAEGGWNRTGSIWIDSLTQKTQDGDFYYLTARPPRDSYEWFRFFLIPQKSTPNMTKVEVKPNTRYTLSFWAKGSGEHAIYSYKDWTSLGGYQKINLTSDWKLYILTVTSSNSIPAENVQFFIRSNNGTEINLKKPKVEEGSTATPYMRSASEVTTADWPKYVGTYVDTNQTSSTEPSKYDWDEMKYRVYLDGVPVGGSKLLSFDLENLKAGTSYNVQVSQINGNVESDKSESVAFKTTLPK